jgi:histidyl-tRNA synthetase
MKSETDSKLTPRIPSGFQDNFAEDILARSVMIEKICRVYESFGFAPLETPAIEYVDNLGKFLPDSDQPDEGIFSFRDRDEQWLALRYDLTAPLARVVAQYGNSLPNPYRRYQVGPVWRQEKPGPGRFRQFYQCDFDTVGSKSLAADAEVCAILCAAFEALGFAAGSYVVRVNDRKILNGVLEQAGINEPARQRQVLRTIDKLDRLGRGGVSELLQEGRKDQSGDYTKGASLSASQVDIILVFIGAGDPSRGRVIDRLREMVGASAAGRQGVEELEKIDALLDSTGLGQEKVRFDPSVVRGLEYYTGPVFESEILDQSASGISFGSPASGGRYDGLVQRFTGAEVPATGASIGVDRLLAAIKTLGKIKEWSSSGPVIVTVMDASRLADYQKFVSEIRAAGIAAELYLGDKGFQAQLKYADKRKSPVVVIAGEDEFRRGEVTLKDMRLGAELAKTIEKRDEWRKDQPAQKTVARSDLVPAIRKILGE